MGTIRKLKTNAFPPPKRTQQQNHSGKKRTTLNVKHTTTTTTKTTTTAPSVTTRILATASSPLTPTTTAPTTRTATTATAASLAEQQEQNCKAKMLGILKLRMKTSTAQHNTTIPTTTPTTTKTTAATTIGATIEDIATTTTTTTMRRSKTLAHQHHHQHQRCGTQQLWRLLLTLSLCGATMANPVFVDNPSLAQFQSGRNIRHLPCIVRKSGHSGICMFAIDCIKQNGTHLGTCIDRFYFGSCCQLKDENALYAPEISDNSIDQNTISHFAPHESPTTLPSSALFKLTTEPLLHIHSSSHRVPLRNSTTATSTTSTSAHKTASTVSSSSKKPAPPLTHATPTKHSQFVVRTSPKPTVPPTTVKPPRRKANTTTTSAPVLTTQAIVRVPPSALEQRIEVTTGMPTKFVTFQIVETTTMPTLATEEQASFTTFRPTHRPKPSTTTEKPKPKPTKAPRPTITTTTTAPTTVRTTARPTPPIRRPSPPQLASTTHQRPTSPKRPTPPVISSSTSSRPTQRPVVLTTLGDRIRPSVLNTTVNVPTKHRPTRPALINSTNRVDISTAFLESHRSTPKPVVSEKTTLAPRPRPQPTAEIVKVTRPTVPDTSASITEIITTPHKRPTTQRITTRPPTSSTKPTTTTEAIPSTTNKSTATTTTATLRPKPTTPKPIESSTEAPLTTQAPKPGLVTWTDVDGEPVTNATVNEDWQPRPRPPADDWVPVPTIAPEFANKTSSDSQADLSASSSSEEISTEKIIISVSTSVSEILSNGTMLIAKPTTAATTHRPPTPVTAATSTSNTTVTTTKVSRPTSAPTTAAPTNVRTTPSTTTTTTTTSTTPKPTIPSTVTTATTTTTTTEAVPILIDITTEAPFDLSNASSSESSTEDNNFTGTAGTGTGSSTIDYSTEEFNATMLDMSTTTPQPNLLEGMDYRDICGRRMFPEPRIVGGSNAAFGRWPWQISLRQWRTSTYLHKCGAALLNENWAITAAHCVDNVPPSDLLLRLGEYDLAEEEEPYGYQERRVQIVASHPQFDPRTFEYDLALLRFYEPVVFQPNIIPVCVPNSDLDFIGQTAFVTGWGRLYEDGPLPSVLQEVAVPVINNTICETMYRTAGYIEHIPHIFICAGWKKGGYDSCEGDSGGPMVLQREDDKRFQLGGVISWGIGCAEANQPGVYTRISEFRDWINQILQF